MATRNEGKQLRTVEVTISDESPREIRVRERRILQGESEHELANVQVTGTFLTIRFKVDEFGIDRELFEIALRRSVETELAKISEVRGNNLLERDEDLH